MKKIKTWIGGMLAILYCILMCTSAVYATGDDTDGTELQVAQPVILEVQLGSQWAGVEFQLKTDAGLYPGTITVGQDGVLRTELGNNGSYVLSCVNSSVAAPSPNETLAPDPTEQLPEPSESDGAANDTANTDDTMLTTQESDSVGSANGGIPVMHLVLFGGGLLLAVGALVTMRVIQNRQPAEREPYDADDDDDYEY